MITTRSRHGATRAALLALCAFSALALAGTGCGAKEEAEDAAAGTSSAAAAGAASGTPTGPNAEGKYTPQPTTGQTATAPPPAAPASTQMGGQ